MVNAVFRNQVMLSCPWFAYGWYLAKLHQPYMQRLVITPTAGKAKKTGIIFIAPVCLYSIKKIIQLPLSPLRLHPLKQPFLLF
jgi:hypothetical protein